ncbi:MAG: transporter related, partial [Bacillota bacterium]|nr:transporter related [Bacillota bacterium]
MKKQRGTFPTIFYFAQDCRIKFLLSIFFAVLSVAGGLIPYLYVYQMIILFYSGAPDLEKILIWSGLSAAGYGLKYLFYGISTTL